MSRRRPHIDENQPEIVAYLEARGATVQSLAGVGRGCLDLLVGYRGVNLVVEVKNPDGRDTVEDSQKRWVANWRGQLSFVRTTKEAGALLDRFEAPEQANAALSRLQRKVAELTVLLASARFGGRLSESLHRQILETLER